MAPRRKVRRFVPKVKKKGLGQGPPPVRDVSNSASYSRSVSSHSSDEDSSSEGDDSDEDDPRDYKRGGYHPVMPYQLYNSRYRVLSKLGAGAFSTVWLCADEKGLNNGVPELVAMKVCKSKKSVAEQAVDEVALLERLQEDDRHSDHVVQMRSHFWHSGRNGRHKCMVFEVMGENLLALVKHHDHNGLPLPMVKRLSRHTLMGLEYIHSRGVLHTDVKLENVLVHRHDLDDLIHEAHRAHCAFTEQKSGMAPLSKGQKKRIKKKQKNNRAKGQEEPDHQVSAEATPAIDVSGSIEANPVVAASPAAAGFMSAADVAAAEACGRPVPPVRQRARFNTLDVDQVYAKLADFGNGCRATRKVTDDIQTRQYRSPEVILRADWDETADIWSAACMFFELITGDFLFEPRQGEDWSRDEDHLALMIELLGVMPPKEWVLSGKYSKDFFTNSGKLKHIKNLKYWSLIDVLVQKYSMDDEEAAKVADFLLPMLAWEPSKRQSATEALKSPWIARVEGESDIPPQPSHKAVGSSALTSGGSADSKVSTAEGTVDSTADGAAPLAMCNEYGHELLMLNHTTLTTRVPDVGDVIQGSTDQSKVIDDVCRDEEAPPRCEEEMAASRSAPSQNGDPKDLELLAQSTRKAKKKNAKKKGKK